MGIYSAYLPAGPVTGGSLEQVRFVSDSKAPLALVFPPFWLAWHKLWLELMVYAVYALGVALLAVWQPIAPVLYLSAIPGFYLLLEGNELVRRKLERSGWRFAGVVDAKNSEEAEIRFFMDHADEFDISVQTKHRPPSKLAVAHPAPVGLFPE